MEERQEKYLKVKVESIWLEYDDKNDILYISFGEKYTTAEESFLVDDNIIVGVRGDELVSITVMEFTKRAKGFS